MTKHDLLKILDAEAQRCQHAIHIRQDSSEQFIRDVTLMYQGRLNLSIQLIDLLLAKPDGNDHRSWDSEQPWSGWVI